LIALSVYLDRGGESSLLGAVVRPEKRDEDKCSSIASIYLFEALEKPGCPICRLVESAERKVIENILYEYVNDPGVRGEIRRSWGLCTHHAWLFLRLALSPETAGMLGAAIIYEDVVSELIERLSRGEVPLDDVDCPVCRAARETEDIYVAEFTRCYNESQGFRSLYAQSPAILCRHHLALVLQGLGEEARNALLEQQRAKLMDVRKRLESLINKHDYRSKEPITRREQEALWEAVEALRGRETSVTLCTPRRTEGRNMASLLKRLFRKRRG